MLPGNITMLQRPLPPDAGVTAPPPEAAPGVCAWVVPTLDVAADCVSANPGGVMLAPFPLSYEKCQSEYLPPANIMPLNDAAALTGLSLDKL